ncbi:MAG: 50S ribosomal protein L25 [Anaerolineaceae bacterium]|nr:MAG: 50S ribosomal protein L25 [Anaerolineaceae bacterium]
MEKVVLKASRRDVIGKQVKAMRRDGLLPAVMYGRHIEKPVSITLNARDTARTLAKVSSSSLVMIELDGKEIPALIREKQRDFIKNRLLHIDFLVVSLTEKLTAFVGIELSGLSLAVKDYNAILVTGLSEIEVECLPADLPEKIVVDISPLALPGDSIHVSDLVLSDKVKVLSSPEEMIVIATAAKVEEVVEAAAVTAEAGEEEPEVIEKGKKEEEGEAEEKK